ncbi:hypothetical protein M0804_009144 [Polistes exclamans]|nr:hypothetical protein M0804_009144 [Polistes exclamans]
MVRGLERCRGGADAGGGGCYCTLDGGIPMHHLSVSISVPSDAYTYVLPSFYRAQAQPSHTAYFYSSSSSSTFSSSSFDEMSPDMKRRNDLKVRESGNACVVREFSKSQAPSRPSKRVGAGRETSEEGGKRVTPRVVGSAGGR